MDDHDDALPRRTIVKRLAFASGTVVLLGHGCRPTSAVLSATDAATAETTLKSLTPSLFAMFNAVAARIVPADDVPGAAECGAAEYVDAMLATPALWRLKKQLEVGLPALNRRCQRMFQRDFTSANPAQQDAALEAFKNSPPASAESQLYEALLILTLEGYLGDPSYGGNRAQAGWKLVGFELALPHTPGAPKEGYDGRSAIRSPVCGNGKGC
jgi:gluconate 2-dehydrogenase gamma chain